MWEIEGAYADGKWHELIHDFAKSWVIKNDFQGKGTLWSVVFPSVNFYHPGNSCFIAAIGLPEEFLAELESSLIAIHEQVRLSDYDIVTRNNGWRPYLHFENGKVWEVLDASSWIEI